ncbi:NUDIX domain-containing protein [Streptacidiphilus monticola]
MREAREEIGVEVAREDLFVVHTTHHLNPEGEPRVGWFLATERWTGEPVNAEPHKCAAIAWYRLDQLPDDAIVPYNLVGLQGYMAGQPFSVHGWDDALAPATHSA